MPMTRYEVRNEYSLADPELYRTADKDDPEALLEGVAMAGLVGVLRQLGDLAEFASEIFHNLHEEVMATAARGHGLMVRVQQLETEVPSIERAFLSQTDHSSFFNHAGIDWHPNLRVDQNLVTQGDLPRFIMDSYEECRAPPRLFLLDKFDVAGAGACLKRYTDPSFFKVETSVMTGTDVQREKKIRKPKQKKGPRWRNGETRDVLPTSHAKLHQLFLEERVENGVSNPFGRAKLKRRLNGFPFDSKNGKSYMEKILTSTSPDHKVLHEVTVNSSSMMLATSSRKNSGLEAVEVRSVSPDRESMGGKRSPPSPPDREEIMLNRTMYERSEVAIDDKIGQAPNSYGISSTLDKVAGEKFIAIDAGSSGDGSITGYQSDGIASEVDNYVDAASAIESEMDADKEFKAKSDSTSSYLKDQSLISDANEEDHHTRSSYSQSTGDSAISDVEINSSRKEISSFFSSDSPTTSAKNQQSEKISAKGFPPTDIPEVEIVHSSSYTKTADDSFPVDQQSKAVVLDDIDTDTAAITNHRSEIEQLRSSLCSNESIPASEHSDSKEVVRKDVLKEAESEETTFTLEDEEKKTNLIIGPPCSPIARDVESQSGDDFPRSPARELVDEPNGESLPFISAVPDIHCHTTDSSASISWDILHVDGSGQDNSDLLENIASTLNMSNGLSQNANGTPGMISSENLVPVKLDDEFPNLPVDFPSDYPDIAHDGDNIMSTVSKGENLLDELDHECSNVSIDAPDQFPCTMEDSQEKKPEETALVNAQSVDSEEHHSNSTMDKQFRPENLISSDLANSPDWLQTCTDACEGDVIPEKEATANETVAREAFQSCEVEYLQGTGITDCIPLYDSEALESSHSLLHDCEEPAGTPDILENNGTLRMSSSEPEATEISGSADLKSLNEVHVLFDESYSEADKSNTADMAPAMPAVSDIVIIDNVCLPVVGHDKLVEEQIVCLEDSALYELENDENCLSRHHLESGQVEKGFCKTTNNDHPEPEVSDTVPVSHSDFEVDYSSEIFPAATIQSPLEQSGLDTEQKISQQNGLGNHVSESSSLLVDYDTRESVVQEKISLPLRQLDQELLHSGEISSELSPSLPINHPQMLDHDDPEGDNDSTSTFSFVHCESPPSVSELPRLSNYDIDVPGYPRNPFGSIFPPSNPFAETNQINLVDQPPLPPLPPVQWRMGKLQHASSSTEGDMINHREIFPLFAPPTPSNDDVCSSRLVPSMNDVGTSLEEMKHSMVQIASEPASKEEKVENSCSSSEANVMHEASAPSTDDLGTSLEEIKHSVVQIAPEPASKGEKVEHSEANFTREAIDPPPKIENKPQQFVTPTSVNEITALSDEDGVANGTRTVKLPWPRNPLVDDVAALDKSKLRKVMQRVRPQIPKVEERDSLLEQIRTKSFNLRPAMTSRPSIRQGPNTNLRVAAILEKANAIRQAFAGSDEDNDDSWSDS